MEKVLLTDKRIIVQEYLENYSDCQLTLDPENQRACNVFNGALTYACNVFINRLILGGSYQVNMETKLKVLDHLRAITEALSEYRVPKEEE